MTADRLPLMWDDTDDAILRDIQTMYDATDPVPSGLVEDVKFALTVQHLHAQIADLTRLTPLGVRSEVDYTRASTFSFSGGDLTAMVSIRPQDPRHVRIDGWVTGGPVRVELRARDRTSSVDADESGRFVFEDVHTGLVQFVLYPLDSPGQSPVITPSFDV